MAERERPGGAAVDDIGDWLVRQGLEGAGADVLLGGFCERLAARGVELHRGVLGGLILHPNYGAMNVVWTAAAGVVQAEMMPRSAMTTTEFRNAPFYGMSTMREPFRRHRLDGATGAQWFPLFDRLKAEGVTEYLAFTAPYGDTGRALWRDMPGAREGVLLSLATCRKGGFPDAQVDYLQSLIPTLALAVKASTTRGFAEALLRTYLGPFTGRQVLAGAIERGAGREIDCALFYCDLRDSTRLAEEMALDDFLALLNAYFDCTAGAVTAHGGEVLKFIGDAVMAIFPVDGDGRPPAAARAAAIAAARESRARRDRLAAGGGTRLDFSVALHAGKVKYGNVGTEDRLDFTVIGPPVNLVARLEGLSKTLGAKVIASARFVGEEREGATPLGRHRLAGVAGEVEVFGLG